MALTGDFAALKRYRDQVAGLDTFVRDVALGSVAKLEQLTTQQFSTGQDPYGQNWAPLKTGGRPLTSLAGEVEVTAFGEGKIRATAEFPLNFHNSGTRQVSEKKAAKQLREKEKARGTYDRKDAGQRARIKEAAKLASRGSGMHDPKRQVVPDDTRGAPETWTQAIEETAEKLMAKVGR